MSILEKVFKVKKVGKQQLLETGDFGLFETVFSIEQTTDENEDLIEVSCQDTLPELTSNKYIGIHDAHVLTGISERKLLNLCESGELESMNDDSGLKISLQSLDQYLNKSKES